MDLLVDIIFIYFALYWINILIYCVLLGLIPAVIARNKGYDFGGWWLYGTFLFVIALPHSILLKSNKVAIERKRFEEGFRKCPFCAEFIDRNAVVCKFCGRSLPEETLKKICEEDRSKIDIKKCPKCGEEIKDLQAIFCAHCGEKLVLKEFPKGEPINADTVEKYLIKKERGI